MQDITSIWRTIRWLSGRLKSSAVLQQSWTKPSKRRAWQRILLPHSSHACAAPHSAAPRYPPIGAILFRWLPIYEPEPEDLHRQQSVAMAGIYSLPAISIYQNCLQNTNYDYIKCSFYSHTLIGICNHLLQTRVKCFLHWPNVCMCIWGDYTVTIYHLIYIALGKARFWFPLQLLIILVLVCKCGTM